MSSILENLLVGVLGALGGRWFLHSSGRLGGSPFIGCDFSLDPPASDQELGQSPPCEGDRGGSPQGLAMMSPHFRRYDP